MRRRSWWTTSAIVFPQSKFPWNSCPHELCQTWWESVPSLPVSWPWKTSSSLPRSVSWLNGSGVRSATWGVCRKRSGSGHSVFAINSGCCSFESSSWWLLFVSFASRDKPFSPLMFSFLTVLWSCFTVATGLECSLALLCGEDSSVFLMACLVHGTVKPSAQTRSSLDCKTVGFGWHVSDTCWALGCFVSRIVFASKVSCTNVSAAGIFPLEAMESSLTSIRNKPRVFRFSWIGLPRNGLCNTCCSISRVAFRVLSNVLESKSGVPPGTIAIFKPNFPIGITNACWLSSVPWFPNLKVTSHLHRFTCRRTLGCKFLRKSESNWLPITVFVAPESRMPKAPCDAKNTGSTVASLVVMAGSGHAGWNLSSDCIGLACSLLGRVHDGGNPSRSSTFRMIRLFPNWLSLSPG